MENKPQRRWKRWLWIGLGIMIAVPATVIAFLQIIIASHGIKDDQLAPPSKLLQFKPAASKPGGWKQFESKSYAEVIRASGQTELAELYDEIHKELCPDEGKPMALRKEGFGAKWKLSEPLSPEDTQWLIEHQDLIRKIMKMSSLSGKPFMTAEEALSRSDEDLSMPPVPNFLMYQLIARVITAESRRLRTNGDPNAAAETLLAIAPMMKSIEGPTLISCLVSIAMKSRATGEVQQWLKTPPDREIALKLREQFEGIKPIDYRASMEMEYRSSRYQLIQMLNSPVTTLINQQLNRRGMTQGLSGMQAIADLLDQPGLFFDRYPEAVFTSVAMKVSADTQLRRFDEIYGKAFESVKPGSVFDAKHSFNAQVDEMRLKEKLIYPVYLIAVPNWDEARCRNDVAQTQVNLSLAGMDEALGETTDSRNDPFTNKPLRRADSFDENVYYSVGPDGEDQHANISYDPTNGTCSAGDIIFRMPKKR